MTAAQSDDRPDAITPEEPCAEINRRLDTDTIEHEPGTAGARDLLHPIRGFICVAVVDDVICAKSLGLLQLLIVHVGGNDTHRREHAQELNRHVPESTDAENDHRAFGVEVRQRPFDGVIRRQCGVTQGRSAGGTQIAKSNQQPGGGNHHVLGHPAVETQPTAEAVDLSPVLAVVLH